MTGKMYKIYIVEDMALNRMELEDQLHESGFVISGSAASAETAWEELKHKADTDLVLVDIHLAGKMNGVWLAQQIRRHLSMAIVYLTAYGDPQTLQEVQETEPNGYLMKPYNVPTLENTIRIAIKSHNSRFELAKKVLQNQPFIFIKEGKKQLKIDPLEIDFIQSDGNYLLVITKSKKYVVRKKMSDIIEELSSPLFIKVHRRYLVNVQKITKLQTDKVFIGKQELPLARKYKSNLELIVGK